MAKADTHKRPPRLRVTKALQKRWLDCSCKACVRWLAWLTDGNALRPDAVVLPLSEPGRPRLEVVHQGGQFVIRCPYCGDLHHHGKLFGERVPHCCEDYRNQWTKGRPGDTHSYELAVLVKKLSPPVADPPADLEPNPPFKGPFRHIQRVNFGGQLHDVVRHEGDGADMFAVTRPLKKVQLVSILCHKHTWSERMERCIQHLPAQVDTSDPRICKACLDRYAIESLEFLERGGRHASAQKR